MDSCNGNQASSSLRHCRLPSIAISTLFVLLAGCHPEKPAAESVDVEPGQAESKQAAAHGRLSGPEKDIRPAVKQVVAAAIAGDYNQFCNDVSGDAPVAVPDQSIAISAGGMLHSDVGDIDFVNADAASFALTLSRAEQVLSTKIEVRDPDTQQRTYVIGVNRLAETVGTTVTNEQLQPPRSLGCSGPIPPAFAMDLWTPVLQLIHFAPITSHCTAIPLEDKGTIEVGVRDNQLKVGDQVFGAQQARSSEGIQISDDGVLYSFTATDNTGYDLYVQPDGSFAMLGIHRGDEHINCI
ncbi:hypothetical protein HPT27_09045 [Permianibacter sp. IMCC34836]|uniref:hypothetical protein n=1 Tax=Permianibacter fluminis TaxID=2738515 RepID=UPI00155674E1|nr:hypothetical protein [Permianibacter fluminis]NQD37171.1 hypothetical protein [Permianibacter fluminis]